MGLRNRFITVTPEAEVLKAKQLMIGTTFCFFSFFDALFSVFASYTRIFAIMYFMMDLRSNNLSHAKKRRDYTRTTILKEQILEYLARLLVFNYKAHKMKKEKENTEHKSGAVIIDINTTLHHLFTTTKLSEDLS